MPTPTMMRTHSTRRAGWRCNVLGGFSQCKHLDILSTPMGSPGATKCSACYIHPAHWSEHDRLSLNNSRWRQETADRTDPTRPISFGPGCQALLPQGTALTVGLVGQVDGSLGKSILLTHFAQPEACPRRAAQSPVLLQDEGIGPETPGGSSERCSPLPRAILLRWIFRSQQQRRRFLGRCTLDLAYLASLHRLAQCQSQVPHPLTRDLPQFLPTRGGGTPAIGIFFDVFISQHCLEGPTSMIQVEDILDQEPISIQGGHEQFIDPLAYTLAYLHGFAWRRSGMSSHYHTHVRQALPQFQPPSLKQLDDLTSVHPPHARCWWVSQHTLDLGMLQELISSASRHEIYACQDELSDDRRIAILPIEAHQSHLWWESKVLQIGRDGAKCRGQFTAIIAIALACIRADPLARMHLKRRAAGNAGSQGRARCRAA